MTAVRLREWLGGVGLSSTFFLPIAAGLEIDQRLFMWTWRHSAELLVAWLLLALLCTAALAILARADRPRRAALALVALGLIPALSLVAVTGRSIRQLLGDAALPASTALAGTAVVCVIAAVALATIPAFVARGLRRLYACTALLTIPLAHFGLTAAPPAAATIAPVADTRAGATCGDVYVLLFDELSYSAVFPREQHTLPNLHALASAATVYHHAMAPPPESSSSSVNTLDAVHAYLGGPGDAVANGPIGIAKRAGYHTEVDGWYFPYCASLGAVADRCHDHSLYNASPTTGAFSLLAPFETAINIWPYQFPTGLLKRPVATRVHARSFDRLVDGITSPPAERPAFRWAHLNVPHSPWLNENGVLAMDAYTPTPGRYARQVEEADRALGRVVESIGARGELGEATIVVLADHASRDGFADDPRHVPLMIRSPVAHHEDRDEMVNVSDVLLSVARGACGSRPSASAQAPPDAVALAKASDRSGGPT